MAPGKTDTHDDFQQMKCHHRCSVCGSVLCTPEKLKINAQFCFALCYSPFSWIHFDSVWKWFVAYEKESVKSSGKMGKNFNLKFRFYEIESSEEIVDERLFARHPVWHMCTAASKCVQIKCRHVRLSPNSIGHFLCCPYLANRIVCPIKRYSKCSF